MKKSLIAMAVLGSLSVAAQAQTNVTVGGVVQANVKSFSIGSSARATTNEFRVDDDNTSRFWLTGTEDLGGGNSAIFYVQNRLNSDVGSAIGDGNGLSNGDTWVGLKGGWGQVTLGKHTMMDGEGSVIETGPNGTALPTSMYGSKSVLGFVGNQQITMSRVLNSVMYKSPSFSGFSGSVGFGASGSNANEGTFSTTPVGAASDYSDGNQFYIKGEYKNGPLFLNLAYWKTTSEGRPTVVTASNADQTQMRLSGSYTLPQGFKIGLHLDRAKLAKVGRTATLAGADRSRSAWELPLSYTFGANTILASFTRAGDYSNTPNSGTKMWMIGFDHVLSKRTVIGVHYSKLDNDAAGVYQPYKTGTSSNGSVLVAGESASILAVSLKHTF